MARTATARRPGAIELDDEGARPDALDDALMFQEDTLHVRRVGHHPDHDVRRPGNLSRRPDHVRVEVIWQRRPVEDRHEVVAHGDQVAGHAPMTPRPIDPVRMRSPDCPEDPRRS